MVGKHPVKLEPVRTKCLKNIRFKPLCIPCAISPTKQVARQMQDWRHPAFTKVHTNHVIQPASPIQNSNTVIQCKNFHILAKKAPLHSLTINFAELFSALAGTHLGITLLGEIILLEKNCDVVSMCLLRRHQLWRLSLSIGGMFVGSNGHQAGFVV